MKLKRYQVYADNKFVDNIMATDQKEAIRCAKRRKHGRVFYARLISQEEYARILRGAGFTIS